MAAHAAKKRRPEEEEAAAAEEVHLAFRGAANALSQVYAHAVAHQKASFVAGERRAMVCSLPSDCSFLPAFPVSPSDRRPASRGRCDLGASSWRSGWCLIAYYAELRGR
jgi:hypothetical protein